MKALDEFGIPMRYRVSVFGHDADATLKAITLDYEERVVILGMVASFEGHRETYRLNMRLPVSKEEMAIWQERARKFTEKVVEE